MSEVIEVTREQLAEAYNLWMADYKQDPETFGDYDDESYDISRYGVESAEVMIKYINLVKEKY